MKKFLLPLLAVCVASISFGCAEEESAGVPSQVTDTIDTKNKPVEVGDVSEETYTLHIANPFTRDVNGYAPAVVRFLYNSKPQDNIPYGSRIGNIIVLNSTCGITNSNQSPNALPDRLEQGQACEINYKIAPSSASVQVDKISIEYFRESFWYGGTYDDGSSYGDKVEADSDINVLNYAAFLEKAKTHNSYQVAETIIKTVGKKGEVVGQEKDYTFNKTTGKLSDGNEFITETFEGGANGANYTITFESNADALNNMPAKATILVNEEENLENGIMPINAKYSPDTILTTSYTFEFTSEKNACIAYDNYNKINVTCEPNGKGTLKIGLKIGKDEYYKEKYLKNDKAYYITKTDIKPTEVTPKISKDVYMYLTYDEKDGKRTYNAECWTSDDITINNDTQTNIFKEKSSSKLTVGNVYSRYDISNQTSATVKSYINVKGTCDNQEINIDYPINSEYPYVNNYFVDNATATKPTSPDEYNYNEQGKVKYTKESNTPNIKKATNEADVYLVLEKTSQTLPYADDMNLGNMNLNVRCYLPEDRFEQYQEDSYDTFFNKAPRNMTDVVLKQYSKVTYNANGQDVSDYVLVKGTCGDKNIETEYPLQAFNSATSGSFIFTTFEFENPAEYDGVVRNNLLAR